MLMKRIQLHFLRHFLWLRIYEVFLIISTLACSVKCVYKKKLSFYIFCLKECEWIDQQLEIWIALKDRVKREKDMGEVFFLVWVNKKIPDLFLLVRKTISPCSTSISVLVSQSSTTTTTMFLFVLIRIFSFWKSIRK